DSDAQEQADENTSPTEVNPVEVITPNEVASTEMITPNEVTQVEEAIPNEVTQVEEIIPKEVTQVEEIIPKEVTQIEEIIPNEVTPVDEVMPNEEDPVQEEIPNNEDPVQEELSNNEGIQAEALIPDAIKRPVIGAKAIEETNYEKDVFSEYVAYINNSLVGEEYKGKWTFLTPNKNPYVEEVLDSEVPVMLRSLGPEYTKSSVDTAVSATTLQSFGVLRLMPTEGTPSP
ncbi:hypothetical protein MJH12_13880, partial [bacterium]|nr:hypothetical protein [bacterium]